MKSNRGPRAPIPLVSAPSPRNKGACIVRENSSVHGAPVGRNGAPRGTGAVPMHGALEPLVQPRTPTSAKTM